MSKFIAYLMKKLKLFATSNLPYKLSSIFFAFGLWFVILNFINPIRTETIAVTLELINEAALTQDRQIVIENRSSLINQNISIQVRGTSESIMSLRTNLRAYIDLGTSDIINSAEHEDNMSINVQIDGNFGENIELLSIRPPSIQVDLDNIITTEFDIVFNKIGEHNEDFVVSKESIQIIPPTLSITGPSNVLGRIYNLVVEGDISYAENTFEVLAYPTPVDDAGLAIISPHILIDTQVSIIIPVHRRGILQILQPSYSGLAVGFGVSSIDWQPRAVEIAGDTNLINQILSIQLSPISNTQMVQAQNSFSIEYNINNYLPQGLYLMQPEQNIVIVTVNIEPIVSQNFYIPIDAINIIGINPNMQILSEGINIALSGLQSIVESIDNISSFANVSNLPPGLHAVPVFLSLPSGVNSIGIEATIQVYIPSLQDNIEEHDYIYYDEAEDDTEETQVPETEEEAYEYEYLSSYEDLEENYEED